jgi:hypothetical protein
MFADNPPITDAVSAQTADMMATKRVLERILHLTGEYCSGICRGVPRKITRNFSQEESVLFSEFKRDISLTQVRSVTEHRH